MQQHGRIQHNRSFQMYSYGQHGISNNITPAILLNFQDVICLFKIYLIVLNLICREVDEPDLETEM